MLRLVLFFIVAARSVTAAGIPTKNEPNAEINIVGGTECKAHEYAFVGSIRRGKGSLGRHSCGCSILNEKWVLTAAHCVFGTDSYQIVGGAHNITNNDEKSRQYRDVTRIIKHPKYNPITFENDICLMKVKEPFSSGNEYVKTIRTGKVNPTSQCTAIGWGTLYSSGPTAQNLRHVRLPFVDDKTCRKSYWFNAIRDSMMCAGNLEGGKDSCQGDSGGPLIQNGADGNPNLVGVVSWGYGCAKKGYPGVYTKVSYFASWINDAIAKNN